MNSQNNKKKKRATMNDVAALAGVTQPTVSYVINNTTNVSQEVKDRVWAAIDELNYKPNYYARSLKTNRSNSIGILIPDISNSYYAIIIDRLEQSFREKNYVSIMSTTNYNEEVEVKNIQTMLSYNVDAIIVAYQLRSSKGYELLLSADCPVMVLEGQVLNDGLCHIQTDNFYGGYVATKHLLQQGLKKIAYIGQNMEIEALKERYRGYHEAMKEFNLASSEFVMDTKSPVAKWEEGVLVGEKLVLEKVEGAIVSSDVIAIGILRSILTAGIQVPQDLAIIGYDDIPMAQLFVPALSTVEQPVAEMCKLAVENTLKAISGGKVENTLLQPRLILRETT